MRDGRVAYRVKYAGRGGTHRVLTPMELLARLAALVPPPRYPLVRYHGVLAPHAKWRSAVVPKPGGSTHVHPAPTSANSNRRDDRKNGEARDNDPPRREAQLPDSPPLPRPPRPASTTDITTAPLAVAVAPVSPEVAAPTVPRAAALAPGDGVITDFGISVRHMNRRIHGLLLATAPRVDWARLMRRTFAILVLRCAHCGGRLRLLAAITDRATARKILEPIGLPAEPGMARPQAREPAEVWVDTPAAPP